MNKNEENYKRSFNTLHLSEDFSERLEARLNDEMEEKKMNSHTLHGFGRIAAAIAGCAVTLGIGGVCYAADLGGIRSKIELWINGQKQEVELESDDEGMCYSWTDEDGEEHCFGGVAIDGFGNQEALSAEDLAAAWNTGCYLDWENGRLKLSYKNLSYDVTDMVREDNSLRVHIADPENAFTYFGFDDITADGCYEASTHNKPEDGTVYIELDASGLSTDGEIIERPDDVNVGTYKSVYTE